MDSLGKLLSVRSHCAVEYVAFSATVSAVIDSSKPIVTVESLLYQTFCYGLTFYWCYLQDLLGREVVLRGRSTTVGWEYWLVCVCASQDCNWHCKTHCYTSFVMSLFDSHYYWGSTWTTLSTARTGKQISKCSEVVSWLGFKYDWKSISQNLFWLNPKRKIPTTNNASRGAYNLILVCKYMRMPSIAFRVSHINTDNTYQTDITIS